MHHRSTLPPLGWVPPSDVALPFPHRRQRTPVDAAAILRWMQDVVTTPPDVEDCGRGIDVGSHVPIESDPGVRTVHP